MRLPGNRAAVHQAEQGRMRDNKVKAPGGAGLWTAAAHVWFEVLKCGLEHPVG
jgi:hypothetical protein